MKRMFSLYILMLGMSLLWTADLPAEDMGRALMAKVMYNEPQQLAILLEKGADVNYRDPSSGSTPLMMACTYGFKDIAWMLIDKGAKINLQADNGATALIGAARRHPEIVKLLLDYGADVQIVSAETGGPFTASIVFALGGGDTEIAELLLENGAKVDEAATKGRLAGYTPLIMAANWKSFKVVRFLVEKGADVNTQAADGATALKKAEAGNASRIVEYLREQGAR